jgi:hypothetical protein
MKAFPQGCGAEEVETGARTETVQHLARILMIFDDENLHDAFSLNLTKRLLVTQ